jgi:hypothetical protein
MLVPFVIDADSLTPDPAWTPAQLRACHKTLLDAWQHIGLLMHDSDRFEDSSLNRAVQALPQKVRPLWQEQLERSPPIACGNDWDGSVTQSRAKDICGVASLALVDDLHAEVEFGMPEDKDETRLQPSDTLDLDVCRLLAAGQATAFKRAISRSETHIEAGETLDAIWNLRFRSLAAAPIKQVSIVDRYAVEQHFTCPQSRPSGLDRFLLLLDRDAAGPRYLTLYSAWTGELRDKTLPDVQAEMQFLLRRLPNHYIKRLNLQMVPNAAFRDDGHDRFVRFGHYVWDLGLGLQVLEGPFASKRSSASFKTGEVSAGYERVERDLAGDPKTTAVKITG